MRSGEGRTARGCCMAQCLPSHSFNAKRLKVCRLSLGDWHYHNDCDATHCTSLSLSVSAATHSDMTDMIGFPISFYPHAFHAEWSHDYLLTLTQLQTMLVLANNSSANCQHSCFIKYSSINIPIASMLSCADANNTSIMQSLSASRAIILSQPT